MIKNVWLDFLTCVSQVLTKMVGRFVPYYSYNCIVSYSFDSYRT